jgi:hypothetical protein
MENKYSAFFTILPAQIYNEKQIENDLTHTLQYNSCLKSSFTHKSTYSDKVEVSTTPESLLSTYSQETVQNAISDIKLLYSLDTTQFDNTVIKIMIENVIVLNWFKMHIKKLEQQSNAIFSTHFTGFANNYLYKYENCSKYKENMEKVGVVRCLNSIFCDHDASHCYGYHEEESNRRPVEYDSPTNTMSYYPFKDKKNRALAHNQCEINFHPLFYKTILCQNYLNCSTRTTIKRKNDCKFVPPEYEWVEPEDAPPYKKFSCDHSHMPTDECPFVHDGEPIRTNIQYSFSIVNAPLLKYYVD